jgi:signal transduction histidine kinase
MTQNSKASNRSWPLTSMIALTVLLSILLPPLVNVLFLVAVPLQDVRVFSLRWVVGETTKAVRLVENVPTSVRLETLDLIQDHRLLTFEFLQEFPPKDPAQAREERDSAFKGFSEIIKTEIERRFGAQTREVIVAMRDPELPFPLPKIQFQFEGAQVDEGDFKFSALQLGQGDVPVPAVFEILVQLKDGSWLRVAPTYADRAWNLLVRLTLIISFIVGVLGAVAYLVSRLLTRPLLALGAAVENFGNHYVAEAVPALGISEYDRIAAKFNELQVQIASYLRERNQMIGAISHDLRTPLTRLRLFSEYLQDEDIKRNAISSIDDMQMMIEDTLSYARGLWSQESKVKADLATMLITEIDAQTDLGRQAHYSGPDHLVFDCFPTSLRRAFANLIENGIKYGSAVGITLTTYPRSVVVTIADRGKGFAPDAVEIAMSPFERLDASRSRSTGGVGLGLTIARDVVQRHGGTLTFKQLQGDRGFEARVEFPYAPA